MRTLSLALLRERRFAARAGDVLLLVGVAIGDAEGKPMTAHKLEGYVGMPRPTIVRRLASLERACLVARDGRGRYSLTDEARRRAAGVP
jgi:DNA-binding IclR family transcriptional regulator